MESATSLQLSSLQRHAFHQTGLIESLSSQGGFFHDLDPDDNWVKLWFTFWGKEGGWDTTQQVIRGFDPIDDFLLPHVVPAECDVMIKPGVVDNCWHLESESIFIRSEYKEAEEFAVSVCGRRLRRHEDEHGTRGYRSTWNMFVSFYLAIHDPGLEFFY